MYTSLNAAANASDAPTGVAALAAATDVSTVAAAATATAAFAFDVPAASRAVSTVALVVAIKNHVVPPVQVERSGCSFAIASAAAAVAAATPDPALSSQKSKTNSLFPVHVLLQR